jgi:hypothetical protein
MAVKKTIKTVIEIPEEPIIEIIEEPTEETVTLSDSHARHGSIIVKHGVIEFVHGQAVVSKEMAVCLREQGFIK